MATEFLGHSQLGSCKVKCFELLGHSMLYSIMDLPVNKETILQCIISIANSMACIGAQTPES